MIRSKCILFCINLCLAVSCLAQNCGKSSVSDDLFIIGGNDSKEGEFPWQVVISNLTNSDNIIGHFCGGSLISDQWVMTAGHCFEVFSTDPQFVKIRLGVTNISSHERTEFIPTVEKIIRHENYTLKLSQNNSSTEILNDICLIKLKEKIDFSKHKFVSPICLPKTDTKLFTKCLATGWGRTTSGGLSPSNGILQKVELSLVSNEECRNASKTSTNNHFGINFHESMHICAGRDNKSVCTGDSGGPFQCQDLDGFWYQIGINSFIFLKGCVQENWHGVTSGFTKIPSFTHWIEKTMLNN